MVKVICFCLYSPMAASTRYRIMQYIEGLKDLDIYVHCSFLLDEAYLTQTYAGSAPSIVSLIRLYLSRAFELTRSNEYDVAIIQGELLPLLPASIERLLLRLPYIYDFDDAYYLKYRSGRFERLKWILGNKFDDVIKNAAAVNAGSVELVQYANKFNKNVSYTPTVVDLAKYFPNPLFRSRVFTIGWIGSPSTVQYLKEVVNPLAELAKEGAVRLVVIGGAAPEIDNVVVENLPWSQYNEVELISSFDVGIMPLRDDEWSRGKCGFKLIQYMACGVPVIASAVGANNNVVSADCGYLVRTDSEWLAALRAFRDNPLGRRLAGEAGRARVGMFFNPKIILPKIAETIKSIVRS